MLKTLLNILLLTLYSAIQLHAQTPNKNYTLEKSYFHPSTSQSNGAAEEVITYYDGLGRPIQFITKEGGGEHQDIIKPITYDRFGRKNKDYLPYADHEQLTSETTLDFRDPTFLLNLIDDYYLEKFPTELSQPFLNPYSQKDYIKSPLNTVKEQFFPGSTWGKTGGGHSIKTFQGVNTYPESSLKKFNVIHPNGDTEKSNLIYLGMFNHGELYKSVVKNENWQSGTSLNTTKKIYNKNNQLIALLNYSITPEGNTERLTTYYVYDDYGNLTYVIPPLASDQITVPGNQTFRVGSQTNFPWTQLVEVDREFAAEYNKRLEQYENEQILNADIENKYNGQGGFTVTTLEDSEELTLNLNFSANTPFALKRGEILSLKPYGRFRDTEVGRIRGEGYEYIFLIKNNAITIEGEGKLSSISQSLNSSQKLTYSHNYPWVDLMKLDPGFVKKYKEELGKYKNEDILNVNIPNDYNGTGGMNISVDKNDMVNVTMNLSTNTSFPLQKGMVIPLKIERKLEDRQLGEAQANGYHYFFSIKDNQLYISGSGVVHSLSNNFSAFETMDGDTDPETVEGLCYIYHYDTRNRLVEKKIPGKGWEHIVYDKLDRPILTQDANMRLDNEWFFTKYDTFDRPVYTGIYTYVPNGGEENSGRLELKDLVSNQSNPVWWETRGTSQIIDGVLVDYTNSSFPMANLHLLTVNYYDEYFYGNVNVNPIDTYSQGITEKTKGLSTNSKVRAVGTNNWIDTFIYYDEKARPIFVKEFNGYFNSEMKVSTNYDFIGNILQTKTVHSYPDGNAPTVTINDIFTYDHQNRLKKHTQSVNDQHEERILENFYDELGQLVSKDVGGNAESLPLQEVNYDYNIRGWMKSINPLDGSNNLAGGDLFSFGLNYNQPSISGTQALFNGNISETHWKTANDNLGRAYAYGYDALNRLTDADYHGGGLVANTNDMEDYSMQASYDKNGNIIDLERKGAFLNNGTVAGIDLIDDLVYHYRPKTNQLERVTDSGYNEGFKDVTGSDEDYAYDANGNMTEDLNKSILNIEYNYLNLPVKIIFATGPFLEAGSDQINYVYDANGVKLKKNVIDYHSGNQRTVNTTNYTNGFIYRQDTNQQLTNGNWNWLGTSTNLRLKFLSHPEGYIEPKDSLDYSQGFVYIYQYKDHLGNVRLGYKKDEMNSMSFLDDFSSGTDGWQPSFSTLNSSGGQLHIDTPNDHDGGATRTFDVHQGEWVYISFDFSSSGPYKFPVTIEIEEYINGNWQQNNVFNSTEQSAYYYQAYQLLASGTKLRFKISSLMDFTIDNFKVEQNAILVVHEKNYYPFGLEHKGYNNVVNGTENNYQTYLGQERNQSLGYNMLEMDWRHYDPAIGRFNVVDPLADLFTQFDKSPFAYAWNNPVFYSDPVGLCPECPDPSNFNEGDTYDVNGVTYVIDPSGDWSRQGGELDEVVLNSTSSASSSNDNNTEQGPPGLKRASRYDYSKDVIPEKASEDWDFIVNGHEPGMNTMFHRFVAILDRDYNADKESQEMVEVLTLTAPIKSMRPKPISLPSIKKIEIDMAHVSSGHMIGGSRVSSAKTLFPEHLSPEQVKKLILSAYENSKKIKTQGDRVKLQGTASDGSLIEMWLNKATKIIETAYPKI